MVFRRVPLEFEGNPTERAIRERRAARAVRLQRVERAGLVPCALCGGTTDEVDDVSLACVCRERRAEVESRAIRLVHEHVEYDDRGDVIAP